jgi:hypothetical protein
MLLSGEVGRLRDPVPAPHGGGEGWSLHGDRPRTRRPAGGSPEGGRPPGPEELLPALRLRQDTGG